MNLPSRLHPHRLDFVLAVWVQVSYAAALK
jgi:hypothetical protein